LTILLSERNFSRRGKCGDVAVVEYPGHAGRHRFLGDVKQAASTQWPDGFPRLKLKPKGFGIFAKGVNYYVPMSVMVLVNYVYNCPESDHEFRAQLTRVGRQMAVALKSGQATLANVNIVAIEICRDVELS
jgi:hypothetical protein